MHDTLSGGRTVRMLRVLNVHTRECVALRAGRGFKEGDVAETLSEAEAARADLPEVISVDNPTEYTSKSLDHCLFEQGSTRLQPSGQADGQRPHRSVQPGTSA